MTITIVGNLEATMNLAMLTTVEVTAPEVLEVVKMAMVEAAEVVAAVEEGEESIYNNTFLHYPNLAMVNLNFGLQSSALYFLMPKMC